MFHRTCQGYHFGTLSKAHVLGLFSSLVEILLRFIFHTPDYTSLTMGRDGIQVWPRD